MSAAWSSSQPDGTLPLSEWFVREFGRYAPAPELFQIAPTAFRFLVDLRSAGEEGVELVLDVLESGSAQERLLATRLLGFLDGERPRQTLRQLALWADDELATEASRSLAVTDNPCVIDVLRELLQSPPSESPLREGVMVNVLYGLCRHGCADGFELAKRYLLDEENPRPARAILAVHVAMLRRSDVLDFLRLAADVLPEESFVIQQVILCCRAVRTSTARGLLSDIARNARVDRVNRKHAFSATADSN